jgi:hypothetical protein
MGVDGMEGCDAAGLVHGELGQQWGEWGKAVLLVRCCR